MTTRTDHRTVTEFGTGLLRTVILAVPEGGFQWRRRPGASAPAAFHPIGAEVSRHLAELDTGEEARLVPGQPEGEARLYNVAGRESVATRLLRDGAHPDLEPPLRGLGRVLNALHTCPPPAAVPGESRALARLGAWLSGRSPSPRAAYAGTRLRELLGAERWETVHAWYAHLLAEDTVLTHGAPGLGSVVLPDDAGPADILVGEDLCLAPWRFDLGWVVGELVELKWYLNGEPRTWQRLMSALVEGYGDDLGETWNRLATLRILLHLHDYTAYVDWDAAAFDRYAGFLTFLIDL